MVVSMSEYFLLIFFFFLDLSNQNRVHSRRIEICIYMCINLKCLGVNSICIHVHVSIKLYLTPIWNKTIDKINPARRSVVFAEEIIHQLSSCKSGKLTNQISV